MKTIFSVLVVLLVVGAIAFTYLSRLANIEDAITVFLVSCCLLAVSDQSLHRASLGKHDGPVA